MLLALVTAQGREDLVLTAFRRFADWEKMWRNYPITKVMPYSFIEDGYLCATRQKTGVLIKIPLDLRLDAASLSVGDVVAMCRDDVRSHFLIHHTVARAYAKVGDPVHKDTVSRAFARAREKSGLTWTKAPPTFHEIRSLSERLYREQGIDTQRLLGHRQASTTDVYNDIRGADWVEVKADRNEREAEK